ncbi:hypothetical protein EB001_22535 [bacterium]|nr:hypothetical protein [bacterium]
MKIEVDDAMLSEIVVQDLKAYHEIMKDNPEEDGVCAAIEKVLSHYLWSGDYSDWYRSVYGPKGEDVGKEIMDD